MDVKNDDENYQYDNGFHPKEVKLKKNYRYYRTNVFYKIWNKMWVYIALFLSFFPKRLFWGFKITGKKNRKYAKGAVIMQNHIHQLDGMITLPAFRHKRLYITMLESNLGFGYISHVFRNCGAVPIPTDPANFKKFYSDTINTLKKGYNIVVFPEAKLYPYCDHIREFHNGAIRFAYESNRVILPCVTTYHKPRGLYKLTRKNKPCLQYNILEPYYIETRENKKETLNKALADVHKIMTDYFIEHSDYLRSE